MTERTRTGERPTEPRLRETTTPGRYDPVETRRGLLESATLLFEQKGFAATSVQEIVERAGVTKGAFYHHFASKEEVLLQIHDEYIEFQVGAIERMLAETDDPVRQLEGLVLLSVRTVERYRSHVAVFLQERRYLTGERFSTVKARRDVVEEYFVDVIRRGMEVGAFRSEVDPRVTAFGIIGMGAWVHQWFVDGGRFSLEDVARMFWAMIYEGLQARPS